MFQSTSPLLKQNVAVENRGEHVVLRIGNVDLTMGYEHALKLSRWMGEEAAGIKRAIGRAKSLRSLGSLSGETTTPLPYQGGTAIHSKPKLCDWHRKDVWSEGRLVCVRISATTIRLHYENVLKLAQWLRVRAKEARNTAGDTRHWSVLGTNEE